LPRRRCRSGCLSQSPPQAHRSDLGDGERLLIALDDEAGHLLGRAVIACKRLRALALIGKLQPEPAQCGPKLEPHDRLPPRAQAGKVALPASDLPRPARARRVGAGYGLAGEDGLAQRRRQTPSRESAQAEA
jgi:hypothetical protein